MKKRISTACVSLLVALAAYGEVTSLSGCDAAAQADSVTVITVIYGTFGAYLASSGAELICASFGNESSAD